MRYIIISGLEHESIWPPESYRSKWDASAAARKIVAESPCSDVYAEVWECNSLNHNSELIETHKKE